MNEPHPDFRAPDLRSGDITTDGLEVFAPYLMNRILRRYNETVETDVRAQGLSVSRIRILAALAARHELTVNDLAVLAVAEQSSTSRLVDQMEGEGLVNRRVSEKDSRSRLVTLTDHGRTVFHQVFPALQRAEDRMMEGLSDADRRAFLTTLRHILHNIRQSPI